MRWNSRIAIQSIVIPVSATITSESQVGTSQPQSQRDLGRRLGFDPSDVVRLIDALERDGHAERRRDPDDRRRNAVVVTDAGRAWLEERLATTRERLQVFLGGLDEDERDQLLRLLQRALAHLDGRVPEGYRTV